jgi:uroporphyrinogen decarboxylase
MRQAGRYLPEYRELRNQSSDFLKFCYTPKAACEATLQPIGRFQFDAAILFSDILVIPDFLGQDVRFEVGHGPLLSPINNWDDFKKLSETIDHSKCHLIFEAIDLIKSKLPKKTALIGFCGAPWTVATYMVAGRGTPDQAPARYLAYRDEKLFSALIERLISVSITYLIGQFKAGVDVIQIFDSWAGVLPMHEFLKWSLHPIQKIINGVIKECPSAQFIIFAKGVGSKIRHIAELDHVSAIGIDTATDLSWAKQQVKSHQALQGNLDPLVLLEGGQALDRAVLSILRECGDRPHIFNLGHGILPQTPISHVEKVLSLVRSGNR